jgi:predicted transcriptional regulator
MLPRPLDTTLAHKAIALTADLSGTDKRVAAATIDSFNRRTGQCDPSHNRIAHLLAVSRRTVIRSLSRIVKVGYLRKDRHGGKSHRNHYQPNWQRFRELEEQWSARRKTRHWGEGAESLSPCLPQTCHLGGVEGDTQTLTSNHSYKLEPRRPPEMQREMLLASVKLPLKKTSHSGKPRHKDARRQAAQRRWDSALLKKFQGEVGLYGRIVEAIDLELSVAATERELARRGEGVRFIVRELIDRHVVPECFGGLDDDQ